MANDETDTTKALPWSMIDSSSDRRHGDMDDGDDDDDTDDDDTDDDTDDDHDDDDTDDDNDHKNHSYTAAGAAPGASVPCSLFRFLRSGFRLKLRLKCLWYRKKNNNNLHFSIFWRGSWKSKSS